MSEKSFPYAILLTRNLCKVILFVFRWIWTI